MFRRIFVFGVLLLIIFGNTLMSATAEEIPVLVWERGQVQNVVLGEGDNQQNWELYLKSIKGKKFKLNSGFSNSNGFKVYSISLSDKFETGGYIIQAENQGGITKQVAGVQVIASSTKEITRVPFELFLVLMGLSFLFFFLKKASEQPGKFRIKNFRAEVMSPLFAAIPLRVSGYLESNNSQSLLKYLLQEEFKFDLKYSRTSFLIGILGLAQLSLIQFMTGNWMTANKFALFLCFVVATIFTTYGLLISLLAVSYSLLNIATAKNLSEILAIFVLAVVFVLPSIYNHFLSELFKTGLDTKKQKFLIAELLASLVSSLSIYQLFIVFESLNPNISDTELPKAQIALATFVVFLAKNILTSREISTEDFVVIRSVGPWSSVCISLLVSLIVFSWTTNLIISIVSMITTLLILTTNWLKTEIPYSVSFKSVELLWGLSLIIVTIWAIYFSIRALPLDVINSSHLSILLLLPLDLLLALYMWLASLSKISEIRV